VVGPIAVAVGVRETLLGAFVLTMASSFALLLIPDMWRITDESPYRVVEAERLDVNPSEG
jgi:hypothetical protein